MANYYWDNIQNWVEYLLEERIDSISDDKEDLDTFIAHTLYSPRTLKEYVADLLEDIEQISNKELLTAILNTVDWNVVKINIDEYIVFNVHINNEVNTN
jgi:F0F1-type ATP synthase delta subunit